MEYNRTFDFLTRALIAAAKGNRTEAASLVAKAANTGDAKQAIAAMVTANKEIVAKLEKQVASNELETELEDDSKPGEDERIEVESAADFDPEEVFEASLKAAADDDDSDGDDDKEVDASAATAELAKVKRFQRQLANITNSLRHSGRSK